MFTTEELQTMLMADREISVGLAARFQNEIAEYIRRLRCLEMDKGISLATEIQVLTMMLERDLLNMAMAYGRAVYYQYKGSN